MIWVIGDIHGCAKTFEALLAQLPADEQKVSVGDFIDRGPDSRRVVELAIEHKMKAVLGNHELMMLAALRLADDTRFDCPYGSEMSMWYRNGGADTAKSYPNSLINEDHVRWLASLPSHLEFPDIKDESGRHLFVSHSACHKSFKGKNPDIIPWWDDYLSIMWNRRPVSPSKTRFYVHGHTVRMQIKVTKTYANIDSGCVFHGSSYDDYKTGSKVRKKFQGMLTALRFPDMKVVQQLCLDEVYNA